METEVRFYYSKNSIDKIITYLKKINEIKYIGKFYEETKQYNHPMKEYDFYSKEIDGRFRVRQTIGENDSKCMITWKRRLNNKKTAIHTEEEVEVNIKLDEIENLKFLLDNVLHLKLIESYERYRHVFKNMDVEIVVDEYPFGVAIEIENKSKDKNPLLVVNDWVDKLKFNIEDAYHLSWDDKYAELCKRDGKKINNIVKFDGDMPQVLEEFNLN